MTNEERNETRGRTIELVVPVDASPEALWEALATGPGLQRWFAAEAEVMRASSSPGPPEPRPS